MAIEIELDEITHDIKINGDISLVDSALQVKQNVKQALLLVYGEYFLGRQSGVPYYQQIFVKNPNPTIIDSIIKKTILSVEGVIKITSLNIQIDSANRELNVDFSALTRFGVISEVIEL
jgi:hypothetical protein